MPATILLALLSLTQDTLRLTPAEALARVHERSPLIAAVRERRLGAEERVEAAGTWFAPELAATAENIGAQEEVTGQSGWAGLEGQVVVTGRLPLGGDVGAARAEAEARQRGAVVRAAVTEATVEEEFVVALWAARRDAVRAAGAEEEAASLERLGRSLVIRAAQGRSAGGEAARASLEATLAATTAARRRAAAAESGAQLARVLGVDPGTVVVLDDAGCRLPDTSASRPTSLDLARADADAGAAAARLAQAQTVPDLLPQLGVRRSAGATGLYLGVAVPLPFIGPAGALSRAAGAEARAAELERDDVAARLEAERRGAAAALAELEAAGPRFGAAWRRDLDRAVRASLARYESGEGTLTDLLDSRRARLAALDDYAAWLAERAALRARVARLTGRPVGPALLCDEITAP